MLPVSVARTAAACGLAFKPDSEFKFNFLLFASNSPIRSKFDQVWLGPSPAKLHPAEARCLAECHSGFMLHS